MTEDQLQFKCVTWFNNKVPAERGYLCRTENKTTTGARDLGLGMVKGMSDMKYTAPCFTQILFELKAPGTRHEVKKLKDQLFFIENHMKRGAYGFFIFTLDQFQTTMANICAEGVNRTAIAMCNHSLDYIRDMIKLADLKGVKTIKLDYDYKTNEI